jgi:hypothetical protein
MPERKDARTPEKFFIKISKNQQPNTPLVIARALPNAIAIIISNDINKIIKNAVMQ